MSEWTMAYNQLVLDFQEFRQSSGVNILLVPEKRWHDLVKLARSEGQSVPQWVLPFTLSLASI